MEQKNKLRNRSVRLTDEGMDHLRKILIHRWQSGKAQRKLTREARAELMGVSVITSDRILRGDPVDRSSLQITFKSLGIEWDDSYILSRVETERVAIINSMTVESLSEQDDVPEMTDTSHNQISSRPNRLSLIALAYPVVIAMAIVAGLAARRVIKLTPITPPKQSQPKESTLQIYDRFHSGQIAKASALLRKFEVNNGPSSSAGAIAEELHIQGDLHEAHGDLIAAKQCYECALRIRQSLKQSICLAPLQEAIGVAETRHGDYFLARKSLVKALSGFYETTDRVGIAITKRDLGALEFQIKHYTQAEKYYRQALQSLKGINKPDIVNDLNGKLALVFGVRG